MHVCQSGSPCPDSYISVWLHNKPCFHAGEERRACWFLSQPYPIVPTYSIRPHVQSPAQPTATYYLPFSPATPSLYISAFSLTNCFAIHVSFFKPLMPQAAVAVIDLSLSLSLFLCTSQNHKLQSCVHTRVRVQHANSQMFTFTQMWCLLLISKEMQLDLIYQVESFLWCLFLSLSL